MSEKLIKAGFVLRNIHGLVDITITLTPLPVDTASASLFHLPELTNI